MKARPLVLASLLLAGAAVGAALTVPKTMAQVTGSDPFLKVSAQDLTPGDRVRAPEFPAGFTWYNTEKPLSIAGLRGKVVLLDFWTYGCINCMHILPDLKKLEAKYPNNLVVISVHSAKFDTESEAANIRNALLRYNIEHPVLVDQKMRVWDEYTVRAWPSFVLIDPEGRVVGQTAGEGQYDLLDETIGKTIAQFRPKGILNETPLKSALERAKVPSTPLWYPGKVAVGAGGNVALADSNHNRLVFWQPDAGKVEAVVGTGVAGLKDGSLTSAQFSNPQGLTFDPEKNIWYVADTNNHAIRAVDLKAKTVTTIAGTGKQAAWRATGGQGTKAALSSPWDVLLEKKVLYIAMAGPHQIWQLDLGTGKVSVFAGSGIEARTDGTRKSAAFAQPSGLASDGKRLFVADSETSSIRAIDLPGHGEQVVTLAGGDLFDFGDKDGQGLSVRLQHPLGLDTGPDGGLYLADTYNSKIKRLDTKTGQVTTVYSGGLYEPGGLAFAGDALYIADTNNNAFKKLDLKSKQIAAVIIPGLTAPAVRLAAGPSKPETPAPLPVGDALKLASGKAGQILWGVSLPSGYHLNRAAPMKLEAKVNGTGLKLTRPKQDAKTIKVPVQIPFQAASSGQGTIEVTGYIAYCNDGENAICKVEKVQKAFAYQVNGAGTIEVKVPGPKLP